ncbi:FAD-dependent oxidoreductase [Arthrobacter sp. Soil736]|uniref:FAD-dependent oxidoreductase n=1 Tax=Arthrobacter sp. Soil736 TaxID=1736395 RepID=UPI0006FD47AA|nr:FAD-dependent oxidoreductase [Arthrobacter sp. Soil736]KRE50937.1 FAD-dependent oxidoreductase [Arthrobacter sp. Soil736]
MAEKPDRSAASLWLGTAPTTDYAAVSGDVEVDVAILGGGIAGLTAALALKRRGLTVAVVEAGRIGNGVTGSTTGKVTSLHRLVYTELAASHGPDIARAYGQANQQAIDHVARTVAAESIDCDFRKVSNYTCTEDPEALGRLRDEADLAAELGLPSTYTIDVPLPYETRGAVRFDDQAQIHAVKYLQGLARAVHGGGSFVFEESPVRHVRDRSPAEAETDGGIIRARDIVVATNLPIGDGGRFAERCLPHRSYIVGSPATSLGADATFISADEPLRSILTTVQDGTHYLLVGGEGHPLPSSGGSAERFDRLAAFARDRLGAGEPAYRWSTQDAMPTDGLPFAGPISPASQHVFVITGLRKWGLTNGTAAALVIADLVSGHANPSAGLFDTNRTVPLKPPPSPEAPPTEPPVLKPGQGSVIDADGERLAVYADTEGTTHSLSATCTHMGCTVQFNSTDSTWDCPCHGSRFSLQGSVIQGPAAKGLPGRGGAEPV